MSFLVGLDLNDVQVHTDSGNASTTAFTLTVASTTNAVAAYISGVRQLAGTDYSVSGTTITFTTAPPTGTNNIMYVYTKAAILNTPADASVTAAKLGTGAVIGTNIQAYDADTLKADTDDTLSGGFQYTADADGTKTSGTYTPAYTGGNVKTATNGGGHTLAPQSGDGTLIIQYTNDGSAGSITTSGWDIVTGDSLTTTSGHDFMMYLTVVGSFQHLHIVALQ